MILRTVEEVVHYFCAECGEEMSIPGLIDKKQDFTTATLELVQNKISGETDAQTIKNAISFGGELGYNALSLTFNIGGARDYFTIVGNSFDKNNNNN